MRDCKISKVYFSQLFELVNYHTLMKLLNIGCGKTFHKDWINIDVSPSAPGVIQFDLRRGLVFPDASFDAVYHSHVLEHLKLPEARNLIDECFRVLKPNGILRVVVPDLESIARSYLDALEKVQSGLQEAEPNYDWMMLELYDQVTRSFRGGEMLKYLRQPKLQNKDFIRARVGREVETLWQDQPTNYQKLLMQKIRYQKPSWFVQQVRNFLACLLVNVIAGKRSRQAFQEGLFRNSGEIHHWMYDRFSLQRMMEQSGFVEVKVCHANDSRIVDFKKYNLDVINGELRKPDSLYMEGLKP